MSLKELGKTLVIANPTAQSGAGEAAACAVEEELSRVAKAEGLSTSEAFSVIRTQRAGEAIELASQAHTQGIQTVVALGGDGIIHETANGLMQTCAALRPKLAIIPIGSGNDYARTMHIARNKPLKALAQMLKGTSRRTDIGLVNGVYFTETLSFGLDAAIALNSMQSRTKDKAHGTKLYASNGVEVFTKQYKTYAYTAELILEDGTTQLLKGDELVFAVQIGPTYGGGFKICPDASPHDGLLSICRSVKAPGLAHTLTVFFAARLGLHTHSNIVTFHTAQKLTIDFEEEPPCQTDGERLTGTHFEVKCIPGALEVIQSD